VGSCCRSVRAIALIDDGIQLFDVLFATVKAGKSVSYFYGTSFANALIAAFADANGIGT
jgi:hypothetical protein